MQEIELKFALAGREEFERIRRALGKPRRSGMQVNHYFVGDARGLLERGEALLRLRVTPARSWLTFKEGRKTDGALYECREVECDVAAAESVALLEGRRYPLDLDTEPSRAAREALGNGPLRVAGASETERSEYAWPGGKLLLDRTRFPAGAEDFEIEIETADPAASEERLRRLLGPLGIVPRPQPRTKVERFLEALARSRRGPA
jgi:uncharacterized protein YjbK